MAQKRAFSLTLAERKHRQFSEELRRKKVQEIESGISSVTEVCRQYEVSHTAVYKWIARYGILKEKPERLIVESKSDTQELLKLKQRIAELERTIGQKQLLIDFKDKMIDLAEEAYGIDIKKKFSTLPSDTFGSKGP